MSFSDDEEPTIFGNAEVVIEKDVDRREWRVFSVGPERQLLVTVPWASALKEWPHAKDYGTAVKTCMASDVALTEDEMASLHEPEPEPEPELPSNVVLFPKRFTKEGQ